jgi:hypothetical protein
VRLRRSTGEAQRLVDDLESEQPVRDRLQSKLGVDSRDIDAVLEISFPCPLAIRHDWVGLPSPVRVSSCAPAEPPEQAFKRNFAERGSDNGSAR